MSISTSVIDNIGRITLDDGKANALSIEWFDMFAKALDEIVSVEAKMVLISGRPKFFSGGLDLKALGQLDAAGIKLLTLKFATTVLKLYGLPVPTVGLVTGHAIAGGFMLASACDFRFGLNGPFKYQLNEVAIGIAVPHWFQAVCESALSKPAFESMALSARAISPQEMLNTGFLSALDENIPDMNARGDAFAAHLAQLDTNAFAASKAMLRAERISSALQSL